MGNLRKGFYTRGNKTTSEIAALTGMAAGDTVFDTDRQERRVFDGNNWVSGNQISLRSDGTGSTPAFQSFGSCSRISGSNNFAIQSGFSATYDENIVGCVQGSIGATFSVGSQVILQYRGLVYTASLSSIIRSQFVDLSATPGRADTNAAAGVGTMGVWLENITAAGGTTGRAFIQPIEIN
jgi:hypothetical protein